MHHCLHLLVFTLISFAVATALEALPPHWAAPPEAQCTVSLMQTELLMKTFQYEARNKARAQVAEKGTLPTARASGDLLHTAAKAKVPVDSEHLVEPKGSSEYPEKPRLQQATSKVQSKTADARLNSELQTKPHAKADSSARKAHKMAPAQLAEKYKVTKSSELKPSNEHLIELEASPDHEEKPRLRQASSKDQSKIGVRDILLNPGLQTSYQVNADHPGFTQLAETDDNATSKLTELTAATEPEESRLEDDSKKKAKNTAIDIRLTSQLQLQSIEKDSHVHEQSSFIARTVAELKTVVQNSSGGLLIMLFVGVLTCLALLLMCTKVQDPNDKLINDWPSPSGACAGGPNTMPAGGNSAMVVLGNRMSAMTAQKSMRTLHLQQRTPVHSSAVLPQAAHMMDNLQSSSSNLSALGLPQPGIRFDLPPICPSLILPHNEARFVAQMAQLKRSWVGSLDILGTSGKKLLNALVCDGPDNRRCLILASCGCEDDPRTCIFTPADPTDPQAGLEIFGKSGKFYGWLEFPGGNQALLVHSGDDGQTNRVLQIDMGSAPKDLRMCASAMDGKLLASAGRSAVGQTAEGKDTWKLEVKPGTDAVLITSCMLALIMLEPSPFAAARISRCTIGSGFTPKGRATSPHEPAQRNGVDSFSKSMLRESVRSAAF